MEVDQAVQLLAEKSPCPPREATKIDIKVAQLVEVERVEMQQRCRGNRQQDKSRTSSRNSSSRGRRKTGESVMNSVCDLPSWSAFILDHFILASCLAYFLADSLRLCMVTSTAVPARHSSTNTHRRMLAGGTWTVVLHCQCATLRNNQ